MQDDCRRRLQSLHTTIFSELHHLSGADMDCLLSGRYDTTSLVHPESSSSCDDNGGFIQKLLFASERLIELVRILNLAYASRLFASPAPPPQPTSSSVVDLPVIVSFLTCYVGLMVIYRNVLTQALNSLRSTDQYRHLRTRPGSSGSPIAGSSFGKGSAGDTAAVGRRGVPPLSALGVSYDAGSSNSGSPQQALRIRILTEVLSHMIERVEDAWDSVTTDEHGDLGCEEDKHSYHHHHQQQQQQPHSRHGVGSRRQQETVSKVLFGRAGTTGLLEQMLAYEGFHTGEEEGWKSGQRCIMALLKTMRKLVRDGGFT
ncbi:uncharacterized protein PG998_010708 [Apiospora kogelbergensis]|uniref:uncharacterized protein n=1 Tax=Apiospora kogelbergensis TaxID=1337665 RepID=UPI00312DF01C